MTIRDHGKRLQLAREHAGYKSGRMAALRHGWKYPTYASHESGGRTFPSKVAAKYAKAFNVDPEFLLFGRNPPSWFTSYKPDELQEVITPVRYMAMFKGATADDIEHATLETLQRRDFALADLSHLPTPCFAIEVQSNEMTGEGTAISEGDILICAPDPGGMKPGATVILSVRRQAAPAIRRVKMGPGGRMRFVASNPDYEPLEELDVKVIGQAVMHIRNL